MFRRCFSSQSTLIAFLLVAAGAIFGALARFQTQNNFLVNILGAGLLGLLSGVPLGSKRQLLLGVGFCGAFTTFSGWILNVFDLLYDGLWKDAVALISLTTCFGLIAVAMGYWIGRRISCSGLAR